jgi:transcriptional regulator NrdR family protein
MRCPQCYSCFSTVYKTRKQGKKIKRYRICKHCSKSFSTTELTDPPKKDPDDDIYMIDDE